MSDCCGCPSVISSDSFTTLRVIDPDTGYEIVYYVDKDGELVDIPPTYHLYGDGTGLRPPVTASDIWPNVFGDFVFGGSFLIVKQH